VITARRTDLLEVIFLLTQQQLRIEVNMGCTFSKNMYFIFQLSVFTYSGSYLMYSNKVGGPSFEVQFIIGNEEFTRELLHEKWYHLMAR